MNQNSLPENNEFLNIKTILLDPLSVIIKLAILSNKPIGTKILIQNNIIWLQEPGLFQAICRKFSNSNKTDLQFMYNPIQIACAFFLSKEKIKEIPRIKNLFQYAQNGLKKLMETYKNSSIITLCLNYYYAIITNHIDEIYYEHLFYKDSITIYYSKELIDELMKQWTKEKIKIVLDFITFLTNDDMADKNVKSLENIMESNDRNTMRIFNSNL